MLANGQHTRNLMPIQLNLVTKDARGQHKYSLIQDYLKQNMKRRDVVRRSGRIVD